LFYLCAADGKNAQDVTRTEALREHHQSGAPKPVDGVLDVYLNGDYTEPRLEGAKLHGVSQEIADRLANLPLANLPMPVRFVLGPRDDKPTIITRDEAGRVRVSGTLHGSSVEQNEVPYAQTIIERFLSMRRIRVSGGSPTSGVTIGSAARTAVFSVGA
jgi:hypothetical protein